MYIVYLRDLYMNFDSSACSYKNACLHPAALARFSTGATLSRSDLEVDSRSIALAPICLLEPLNAERLLSL